MTASAGLLSRLGKAERAALEARWTVSTYRREETIVAHDEQGRDVFFVLEGRARATVFSEAGRVIAYRDIEPDDIFGELSAIDGNLRSASVVALEDLRVARLSGAALREIVNTRPAFAWALLEHLSGQMRRMTDRVYEFSTLVVRDRLIRELLRLSAEVGDGQARVSPAPTHFDLAAKISTHREAVSREMSMLAKLKLIERHGDSLVLRDLAALRALSHDTR